MSYEKEALYYNSLSNKEVKCSLCPHNCNIKEDKLGLCRVRYNNNGILYSLSYGKTTALAVDPIEKKPLYHFYPNSTILSVGSFGCNLSCGFCQNYRIAHSQPDYKYISPELLCNIAEDAKQTGSVGVAFTYNEPSIWYEYIYDTAKLLKKNDIKTVLVTNGYIELEPLKDLIPYIDAMNIDVKAFTESFYKKNCKGKLNDVKRTVEFCSKKTHIEITTLLIPSENDSSKEITDLVSWISSINSDIPIHLSRYFPAFKFKQHPTPENTMYLAKEIASKYLAFVYMGNIPGIDNNTYCKICQNLVINRNNYEVNVRGIQNNSCKECGNPINIAM
ncbi:Radical SAM, Pyruvate-formate lyase-activating enzyme like [Candidatus Syntrophocurvum alkaliphilum]|uniref:Radical SAM, Pyruvate-formate lyase-activating enzyme like n=1 Tax=Candidatus Syntrophocurvum alkaliphilum TaxID=2293317 RepID=A0A6I6DFK8_9FIRM|nr:AmmeMemoRadiSam system radical SAM enzyme [Candidatus Syntrophocurvum alkaliphilum]QGU00816.1 Radical SAM, Pyruvate-formate lyase-activating enzyme like [Candidatus Syntrophocurvum alkaliphilum]